MIDDAQRRRSSVVDASRHQDQSVGIRRRPELRFHRPETFSMRPRTRWIGWFQASREAFECLGVVASPLPAATDGTGQPAASDFKSHQRAPARSIDAGSMAWGNARGTPPLPDRTEGFQTSEHARRRCLVEALASCQLGSSRKRCDRYMGRSTAFFISESAKLELIKATDGRCSRRFFSIVS